MALLWWGMNTTVSRKYPRDRHPEPHSASARALNACESAYVTDLPSRFRTKANNFHELVEFLLYYVATIK